MNRFSEFSRQAESNDALWRNTVNVLAQFNQLRAELKKDKTISPDMIDPLAAQLTNAIWSKPNVYT